MTITATRKLEFDAGHRLVNHESKCAHCHGHRYVVEVTAQANALDDIGRVIDFSVIKRILGAWIDKNWDHAMVVNTSDVELIRYLNSTNQRHYILDCNPTAENMASFLIKIGNDMLMHYGVTIVKIKLWETPNCFVEVTHDIS